MTNSDDEELVPVFMPSLAMMLVRAEDLKGGRLTETEVLRIRDHAACIMMKVSAASKMDLSRGYSDVIAENCWADWQRLRVHLARSR